MNKEIIPPCMARNRLAQTGAPIDHWYYATPNFSWQELLTKQKEIPSLEVLNNLLSCARVLEVYREKLFQGSPITITSGWRSHIYNKQLGGAPNSYHCKGMAVDFNLNGYAISKVYELMDKVHWGGVERTGGDWQHIDIRPTNIRFDRNNKVLACHYSLAEHDKIFHPEKKKG